MRTFPRFIPVAVHPQTIETPCAKAGRTGGSATGRSAPRIPARTAPPRRNGTSASHGFSRRFMPFGPSAHFPLPGNHPESPARTPGRMESRPKFRSFPRAPACRCRRDKRFPISIRSGLARAAHHSSTTFPPNRRAFLGRPTRNSARSREGLPPRRRNRPPARPQGHHTLRGRHRDRERTPRAGNPPARTGLRNGHWVFWTISRSSPPCAAMKSS